ncbi:isocitrate lyase/phosphoenolpyruvate mutase family protein [Flavobacterium amniphilum]|uniref:isocitrate lyase/PEP mutase family protein n=1 Tax=Flavobacterium amniphilum TaxID=1834035 RepID=UPI00202A9D73|nr:isocitrate lyase/phosphoenolpyruvate mutase family protein [Flavobacterium amniphilum]MCL9807420.1 isocitrate lyase/phosphoenolpyruvate mutase family protein [Flavobacterium amniphilum]
MTTYLKFKELHNQTQPLIIGNVWNVQSAKIYEKLNFQAIGTSSAAIAHSLGYEDGEQMPFSDVLFIVERIKKSVTLPLSVDIEFGYGKTATEITDNIITLEKLGIAGINIEDSFIENNERKLKDCVPFSRLLKEVKTILTQQGISIFINVRCDSFLLNVPNTLQVTNERLKMYEQAGSDGIFLPCITKESDIATIVLQTKLPLNVMCMPELPNFETLQKIGVKRISMGNFLNSYAYTALENMTTKNLTEQSFKALF